MLCLLTISIYSQIDWKKLDCVDNILPIKIFYDGDLSSLDAEQIEKYVDVIEFEPIIGGGKSEYKSGGKIIVYDWEKGRSYTKIIGYESIPIIIKDSINVINLMSEKQCCAKYWIIEYKGKKYKKYYSIDDVYFNKLKNLMNECLDKK